MQSCVVACMLGLWPRGAHWPETQVAEFNNKRFFAAPHMGRGKSPDSCCALVPTMCACRILHTPHLRIFVKIPKKELY
jgi:hypothetical protein